MYAIISTGGKQYRVCKDQRLKVELLNADVGAKVKLPALMISRDGAVSMDKEAYATAEVLYNGRGVKLNIFTYKAKKNQRKRQGHRQPYSEVKILEIVG